MLLLNAFSLAMVQLPAMIKVEEIDLERVKDIIDGGFKSCVGHADAASTFSNILGRTVVRNRDTVGLKPGEKAIVGGIDQVQNLSLTRGDKMQLLLIDPDIERGAGVEKLLEPGRIALQLVVDDAVVQLKNGGLDVVGDFEAAQVAGAEMLLKAGNLVPARISGPAD